VRDIAQHLREANLQSLLGAPVQLAHDEHSVRLLHRGRRRHPVERLVAAGIRVDEHRAVRFQEDQARGLREEGRQAARVADLAAGDDETHGRVTVLSISDVNR
jgi:hypothetical protein